ncbi:hypothetical protein Pmani_004421 [Petrolisthes manimaculis]|uniref:Uncharacterized protein n=1 Tax=Petrolisthes manimaculis TaxID=1843537 RepID=A0AAE1UHJ3_9EUCA|nr:hypothetical protein Pmani_004421 [Petrolisthes manimaculis]
MEISSSESDGDKGSEIKTREDKEETDKYRMESYEREGKRRGEEWKGQGILPKSRIKRHCVREGKDRGREKLQ